MPGRIRSIKPEFFTSPDTGRASLRARLFYVALWCWADDYGIGETNFNMLAGFAFPEDDQIERKELPSLCKEVAEAYGTMFYTVSGRHYYSIPTWDEHQRTQRKAAAKYPTPDHPESAPDLRVYGETGPSAPKQGTSASTQGSDEYGTGEREQGKGNRGENTRSPAPPSSVPDPAPDRFDEFWEAYPRKVGKQKARTKFTAACKRADAQAVIDGAHRLANDPNLPETQYIPHPTTWLERDGWDDEPLPPRNTHTTPDERKRAAAGSLIGRLPFDDPAPTGWGNYPQQIGRTA